MARTEIKAINLGVKFGALQALDDLSFEIFSGTSTALVGPNGSGKTTLLNVVAGLTSPSSGSIVVRSGEIGFVLQHSRGDAWAPLTCLEVVRMGRYPHTGLTGRFSADDHRAVGSAAERAEISDLMSIQYAELSGGQRQRVLIAQVLAQEAELILLDEPMNGLDIGSQNRILQILRAECEGGRTVLISTHHLDEARECDGVFLLAGSLIASGPANEVLVADTLEKAYGGRVLRLDDRSALLDEHGHG